MLIPFGVFSAAGAGAGAAAGAYELISSQILTSTAASVTFSSIPSTYKHLQIRTAVRANFGPVPTTLQFNGDTGSNYATHYLQGDGSSVTSGAQTSASYVYGGYTTGSGSVANSFGAGICDILDYASTTKNKTTRALIGVVADNTVIQLRSGVWLSTSAITSATIAVFGQSFQIGSRFSLYGIRG